MAQDSWCSPIVRGGRKFSGAAAREIRIKEGLGMDEILAGAIAYGVRKALDDVNMSVSKREKAVQKPVPKSSLMPKTRPLFNNKPK